MSYSYEFPRAALTVDCVVFGLDEEDLKVLLIQRDLPPFEGRWALPGGFVHLDETLEEAARRELREETGIERVYLEQLCTVGEIDRDPRERVVTVAYYALVKLSDHRVQAATDARQAARRELREETGIEKVYLEQLCTVGEIDRDPRERVVTVAYYALVKLSDHRVQAATDARQAAWFAIDDLPRLAFDHDSILATAHERLRGKVRYRPIGFELLPDKFALRQLQHLYEAILDRPLDKRNFRKKILGMDILVELDEIETDVAHRAARLYRFDRKKYRRLTKRGFNFEI